MSSRPEPRLGPVGPEHAGELLTVQYAAYVQEAQLYDTPFLPPLNETVAGVLADIEAPEVLVIGAWLGPRLVGSIRGRPEGTLLHVVRLAVAPDVQRGGVGRALLTAVERAAPPQITELHLNTGSRSAATIRLYQTHGYRVLGTEGTDTAGVSLTKLAKTVENSVDA